MNESIAHRPEPEGPAWWAAWPAWPAEPASWARSSSAEQRSAERGHRCRRRPANRKGSQSPFSTPKFSDSDFERRPLNPISASQPSVDADLRAANTQSL